MRLRQLIESPSTAVFAFGRMNPPTIGHRKLADKVKSIDGTPFIFLTHTQKPKTDPLTFAEKVFFAQKSFGDGIRIGDKDVKTIIQAMQKLKDMDVPAPDAFRLFRKEMENLSIIIGTKLLPAFTPVVQFIGNLLKKFFKYYW